MAGLLRRKNVSLTSTYLGLYPSDAFCASDEAERLVVIVNLRTIGVVRKWMEVLIIAREVWQRDVG